MPTHDWSRTVDLDHLARVRSTPVLGGALHLLLEVMAYVVDEAVAAGPRRCEVVLPADGSVSVADDGRGMSVVAAWSEWLVDINRRAEGSWTQRYERGVPVTDLQPLLRDDLR